MVRKAGTFIGSWYSRGRAKDKWGNRYKPKVTWRQRHSGIIITEKGTFLGIEKPLANRYGRDEKKIKKPETFVRANLPTALKPRKSHMRRNDT